ncbi:hypothetical protein DY000_02040389 [Brassica cretica]|uniref:DUF3741 domain-containing protein n=1 Tax=Brassica cretica TaxID=69181 RepID=A0ABQ7B746_BRACR|nr:hypothetical protein DY000_02040389 [Brassica cretica]
MDGLMSYRRSGRTRSLRSDRASARARSLRSDQAEHVFVRCVAILFELLSDDSHFLRKVFRKEESISKKYLSKKVSTFSSSGIWTLTSSQPFLTPTVSPPAPKATFPPPIPTSLVEAPACVADHLSFRDKLVRRQAEKEQVRAGAELPSSSTLAVALGHGTEGVTPRDTGTLAGSVIPDASALPAGSSTTPILVEDKERDADSMPPPPARKEIVLALHTPSVVLVAQPKGRKRKFTKGGDGESSQQGDSSIASGLRGKFMSLIDGMISKCGSETSCLAGELLELQGRWSETEAMLTAVKDSHSVKVSKLEVAIGEL